MPGSTLCRAVNAHNSLDTKALLGNAPEDVEDDGEPRFQLRLASMVNEKKLEGIAEIRDESSMEGLRIVFEIKRDAEPLVVLNNMYKRSSLQHTFAGNLMAVVGAGRMPELLTLRSALTSFLDFRVECLESTQLWQTRALTSP